MLLKIPTEANNNPSFIETIDLEGIYYKFKFSWNNRDTCWLLDIYNINGNVLIGGVKLVVNYELISHHKVTGMPSGKLVLFDTSLTGDPCLFDDLGTRCVLYYLTSS
jgi:hypothetical protein